MILGDVGEDLPVEDDAFRLQSRDEAGVCHTKWSDSGVDASLPLRAGVSFLVSSVGESVSSGVADSDFSLALFGRAAEAVAFDGLQDIFSPL